MTKDALDRLVVDAQSVQVRGQTAPEGVPAVPLRQGRVSLVLVLSESVAGLGNAAVRTLIEHRLYVILVEIVEADGRPGRRWEHHSALRIAELQPMHLQHVPK